MPRASWRRFLRLSLVSCPIYLYFVRCVSLTSVLSYRRLARLAAVVAPKPATAHDIRPPRRLRSARGIWGGHRCSA